VVSNGRKKEKKKKKRKKRGGGGGEAFPHCVYPLFLTKMNASSHFPKTV